jgi:hypothetical protein
MSGRSATVTRDAPVVASIVAAGMEHVKTTIEPLERVRTQLLSTARIDSQ